MMRNPGFALRNIGLIFLLVLVLQTSAQLCTAPQYVSIAENNLVGAAVGEVQITEVNVTVSVSPPENTTFGIVIDRPQVATLVTYSVLDHETTTEYVVTIICKQAVTNMEITSSILILVTDMNDNAPAFGQSQYSLPVDEWLPAGTSVGRFTATDKDQNTQLYYSLIPNRAGFVLSTPENPVILVEHLLDYDTVKNVMLTLYAQDTAAVNPPGEPSFTGSTTILVTITDVDNRPPWFQPCSRTSVGGAAICVGAGYTGTVNLTETEVGALPLEPGPVHAIDGDSGRNAEITYSFLSGNDAGVFKIDPDNGNISMLKAADVPGPNVLTVLAVQRDNANQFATTTVTITALVKSDNLPRFEKTRYEGVVTGVGAMALDPSLDNQALRIQAKDADFPEGLNPAMKYTIPGRSDFSVIDGYLFMTRDLPDGLVSLQVEALDPANGESDTAELTVEVTAGLTTMAPNTTAMPSTLEPTTPTEMTSQATEMTSQATEMTSGAPATTSETEPSTLAPESTAAPSTAGPPTRIPVKTGDYRAEDMAALGASLAVLLVVCVAVIGFLIHRVQTGKANWRKISEASVFRSSLGRGPGGLKEGVQYTNDGFQNDEDTGSVGSGGPADVSLGGGRGTRADGIPLEETILKSMAPLHTLLVDSASLADSYKADEEEKEVKPILTKERRVEEGYKSVWFKEDIDPNAKEDVVIIPGNAERDGDEEDEEDEEDEGDDGDDDEGSSSGREEDEEDNSPTSKPTVVFADTDMDSGLHDPTLDSDSEEDEEQTGL